MIPRPPLFPGVGGFAMPLSHRLPHTECIRDQCDGAPGAVGWLTRPDGTLVLMGPDSGFLDTCLTLGFVVDGAISRAIQAVKVYRE